MEVDYQRQSGYPSMIPQAYITEWQYVAPWQNDAQIEQDLVISRILVEIFNNESLRGHLLFRGETALHKIYFQKPLRYSEDLDLVQKSSGGIKPLIQSIQETINPWLGKSTTESRQNGFRVYYSFIPESDPEQRKRIKIEINTREHFSVFPIKRIPFEVKSRWYNSSSTIETYDVNELAGTKLRALYQRKKGRDLFDLSEALEQHIVEPERVIQCFNEYVKSQGLSIRKRDFYQNMEEKLNDYIFLHDTDALLLPTVEYDPIQAGKNVKQLIELLE